MSLASKPIPNELLGTTVSDMWDELQGWNRGSYAEYLPLEVVKQIQSFELKEDNEVGDLLYCGSGKKGKFSIKSSV